MFKPFGGTTHYADIISSSVDVLPPNADPEGETAIRVWWLKERAPTSADDFGLRVEGNLHPPIGNGGSAKEFHWAAMISSEGFTPHITFYDQLIDNYASGVRLSSVTTNTIQVRIKAHNETTYSSPLEIIAAEVPNSPEGAIDCEIQGYTLLPSSSDSNFYLMEMKVLEGGAIDYGNNVFDADFDTVETFEIGYVWKFRVDYDGNIIQIQPPTIIAEETP